LKKILFVCLGNICRSPLAEGVAKDIVKRKNLNYEIDSAGTSAFHKGQAPCINSQIVAKNHNIDISKQKSRPLTNKDISYYDYIVAMDANNIYDLKIFGVKNPLKLGEFGYEGESVPDPYNFRGFDGFEKVYQMIEFCVENFIKEIENE